VKCPKEINDAYFRGELSLSEIDCEPWDSNYQAPATQPIEVGGKLVERRGESVTVPTRLDVEFKDDQPADKAPCPCKEQNPMLWLLAGLAIGYAIRQ